MHDPWMISVVLRRESADNQFNFLFLLSEEMRALGREERREKREERREREREREKRTDKGETRE